VASQLVASQVVLNSIELVKGINFKQVKFAVIHRQCSMFCTDI
jgi:hypothetical protein